MILLNVKICNAYSEIQKVIVNQFVRHQKLNHFQLRPVVDQNESLNEVVRLQSNTSWSF